MSYIKIDVFFFIIKFWTTQPFVQLSTEEVAELDTQV